jgi:hypothetical protein
MLGMIMADMLYAVYEEQPDERVKIGFPTLLHGVFDSEEAAEAAVDQLRASNRFPQGEFVVSLFELDEEFFREGFITETWAEDD